MPSRSSSLLTKTQRRRLSDGFADLDEDERRRDEGRIRDRLETGLFDFEHLADLPDRQFELAFDDVPRRELTEALADAHVVTERIREVNDVDREAVVGTARERATAIEGDADARSLDRVAFRTEAEIREESERRVRDRLTDDRWQRRQKTLLDIVGFTLFPAIILLLAEVTFGDGEMGSLLELLMVVLIVLGGVALVAAMVIKSARALKYDVAPGLTALYRDPQGTVRTAWDRL